MINQPKSLQIKIAKEELSAPCDRVFTGVGIEEPTAAYDRFSVVLLIKITKEALPAPHNIFCTDVTNNKLTAAQHLLLK